MNMTLMIDKSVLISAVILFGILIATVGTILHSKMNGYKLFERRG